MPELPEVQTVVDELREHLTASRFGERAVFLWPGTAGYPEAKSLAARLVGRHVVDVRRRAKYILIELDDGALLVIHLRMTGNLYFARPSDTDDRYLRVRLPLSDGRELRFADKRKFGRLYLGSEEELASVIPLRRLGPEPLDDGFTVQLLRDRLRRRHRSIKSTLLDQSVVAGLGNIYADEALFRGGIDPRRLADSLREQELADLHAAIGAALREAVSDGGTSFRDYRNTSGRQGLHEAGLQVFRRHGQPCVRCGLPVQRTVVGGRGTHFCAYCQR